jgi:hypothetical protein
VPEVNTQTTSGGSSGSTGGKTGDQQQSDPVKDLTQGLTGGGKGDENTALPGVPSIGEATEDLTDPLVP